MKLDREDLLKKIVKTFELIQVDAKLLGKFSTLIKNNSQEEAFRLLKNYNEKCERKMDIKIARPAIHGFEEGEVFTLLLQEAYVTALVFHAEDRLLNAMWSEDWELADREP